MNILQEIISEKEKEVQERSSITPLDRIKNSQRLFAIRDFPKVLQSESLAIIAEIKKQSPSSGDICIDADPLTVAKSYEKNGAAAISVLTDQPYFGGKLEYIQQVKNGVSSPVLRKDFIISEYQIWESFQAGADAILLIADALEKNKCRKLYSLAEELGMHVLLEIHSEAHLNWVLELEPKMIGINCRDLKSMKTDLHYLEKLVVRLPETSIKVAES
ncbi:MAG: indole-3-glycerol phosphate synthase TrpC [Candidatus Marinimicrobia bacterium]|nr:indole-3-glycerol phosphate synthase TrpC [Candidatus Neomarinimicrobiota bacterium]